VILSYLLDEHVPAYLRAAVVRRQRDLNVWRVGEAPAPPLGTSDPDLLRWCETVGWILVTNDRRSMPLHLVNHLSAGGHVPGIFILDMTMSVADAADHLWLIAFASFPDEYRDSIRFLPLQ
jgi:hypothetical protein